MKKTLSAILALAIGTLLAVTGVTAANADAPTTIPWDETHNQPSYWEDYGPHDDAQCFKHEADDDGNSTSEHGSSSGSTVTLAAFNQAWFGDHYELLVIKAGDVSETVVVHPTAGAVYNAPQNSAGQVADVSHWIVCKGVTPDTKPADAVATITTTPGACDAPGSAAIGTVAFATWDNVLDTTPGTHVETFTVVDGHTFAGGETTLGVEYTVPGIDTSKCETDADAVATITTTPGTCAAPGSAAIGTVTFATWDNVLDTTPGTHVETFTAVDGHTFAGGETTLGVEYTVPGVDTSKCDVLTECPAVLGNVHSTDFAPNGWAGDGEHIEGGYQLTVDSAWEQVWIERAVNAPLADVLAGLDIVASPIQYVGLHFETTDGRFLTYEEEPSYGGALWSNDSWAGVSAGMGYTAFGQPEEFVAQNGDVMVKTVYLLYTHPTGSVTDITSASFDCTLFTFDKDGDLTTLGPVVPFAEFKDLTCEADGSITFGNNETAPGAAEPAVTWTVNGAAMTEGTYPVTAAGTVSLVATAVGPEYFFDLDTVSEFEHQFTEPTGCDLPTLALTGTNSTPTFAIATLLGLLGVTLAGYARRNARLDFTS